MKNIVVLFLLSVFGVANAASNLVVLGDDLLMSTTAYESTGVKVTPEAQKRMDMVAQAFGAPDKLVVGDLESKESVTGLFSIRKDTVGKIAVKYDTKTAMIAAVKGETVTSSEAKFFWFPVWWLAAIVAMFVLVRVRANERQAQIAYTTVFAFQVLLIITAVANATGITLVLAWIPIIWVYMRGIKMSSATLYSVVAVFCGLMLAAAWGVYHSII